MNTLIPPNSAHHEPSPTLEGAQQAREEYINVEPNVRLHVTDAGSGRVIILLHGWPLSDEMYEYQYTDLLESGCRVLGITLRGFGKSDKPYGSYDYDVHVHDINVILDKLAITDAVLCGFSMGGAIAIRYAACMGSDRITKLALFAAAAPSWTKRHDYPYNLSTADVDALLALNYSNRPQLLSNVGKIFAASETALSPGIGSWLYGIGLSASAHAMGQTLKALRDTDLRGDLSKITVPTLIMHGKKDKICAYEMAEQLHIGIAHSTVVTFENSGHALFLEETEKFNAELINFTTHQSANLSPYTPKIRIPKSLYYTTL